MLFQFFFYLKFQLHRISNRGLLSALSVCWHFLRYFSLPKSSNCIKIHIYSFNEDVFHLRLFLKEHLGADKVYYY